MSQNNLPGWISDHIKLYQQDPEAAHMWDSGALGGPGLLPTLLLTTTGRKSGEPKPLPLIYKEIDGNFVIIASKGGAPSHPVWYLNLEANPDCEIQVASRHFHATMRVAEGSERSEMWAQMAEIYPPYNAYQEAAGDRQIPVVVLEPKN
jgi:deazaflavin-dependent oxidoreductase (nitroreductase family)